MQTIAMILSIGSSGIATFMVQSVCTFTAFALVGSLLFNNIADFKDVWASSITLVSSTISGDSFSYPGIDVEMKTSLQVFHGAFIFLILLYKVNLFVALLNAAYAQVRKKEIDDSLDLPSFVFEQIRVMLGLPTRRGVSPHRPNVQILFGSDISSPFERYPIFSVLWGGFGSQVCSSMQTSSKKC